VPVIAHCMKFTMLPVLGVAAILVGCAPTEVIRVCTAFYFDQRPSRDQLVGRWRSARDTLAFLPNGKFTGGSHPGCWEVVDGDAGTDVRVRFVMGCANYGNEQIRLAVAEGSVQCAFTLTRKLTLRDCEFAGEYTRE
jgi:hypothetical protein